MTNRGSKEVSPSPYTLLTTSVGQPSARVSASRNARGGRPESFCTSPVTMSYAPSTNAVCIEAIASMTKGGSSA